MKTSINRVFAMALLVALGCQQLFATCGGGGGGGVGGMSSGDAPAVYRVPWRTREAKDPPVTDGLILYWLPASNNELKKSSLLTSRTLSLYASQCVSMEVTDFRTPLGQKLAGGASPPLAVLAQPDGAVVTHVDGKDGMLRVGPVEKMVESEMKRRESAVDVQLIQGKEKAKSRTATDTQAAISALRQVVSQKCMFPKKAKDAAKELKKLNAEIAQVIPDGPVFDRVQSAHIEQVMMQGLRAELRGAYRAAEKQYLLAHKLDPADPAPLRYLGEVYRHQTGEWDKARIIFNQLLAHPADPLSRAVALHGLGKMTIHDGDFAGGLALMEESARNFPLALTYRNLAVYWNSEGDKDKTAKYVEAALKLDPDDAFNQTFAAVFMASAGRTQEALKIARSNHKLLPASYNLAAVYAQAGQQERALELLKRHFFTYERYDAVRAKEMMEARVDAVFDSLRNDVRFVALTSGADGKLMMPANRAPMH